MPGFLARLSANWKKTKINSSSSNFPMEGPLLNPEFVADEGVSLTFSSSCAVVKGGRQAARPAELKSNQEDTVQQEAPAAAIGSPSLQPQQMQIIVYVPPGHEAIPEVVEEEVTDKEQEETDVANALQEAPAADSESACPQPQDLQVVVYVPPGHEAIPEVVEEGVTGQEQEETDVANALQEAPANSNAHCPQIQQLRVTASSQERQPPIEANAANGDEVIEFSCEEGGAAGGQLEQFNEAELFFSSQKQQMAKLGEDHTTLMVAAQQVLDQNEQLQRDLAQKDVDISLNNALIGVAVDELQRKEQAIGQKDALISQLQQNYHTLQAAHAAMVQLAVNAETQRAAAVQRAELADALLIFEQEVTAGLHKSLKQERDLGAALQAHLAQVQRRSSDRCCCSYWEGRCSSLSQQDSGSVADASVYVRMAGAASSSKATIATNSSSSDDDAEEACTAVGAANVELSAAGAEP